jgi:hypothetical protein
MKMLPKPREMGGTLDTEMSVQQPSRWSLNELDILQPIPPVGNECKRCSNKFDRA